MLQNTRAIILRTVPFGDTSLVVTALTRMYGLQSYMVKGGRSISKKGQSLRPYLQPGALLDLVVYHHPTEHLQYIREMRWAKVYNKVLSNVVHHAVADFMLEMLLKCIRQSECNPELYDNIESYFIMLDEVEPAVLANFPLHFTIFMASAFGFCPENNYQGTHSLFYLREGKFLSEEFYPGLSLNAELSNYLHQFLSVTHPVTLYRIKMSRRMRRQLMQELENYFNIHLDGFGKMKSLKVLESLFD
jgi:DNA repair protein RecO (recombination protein O)